MRIIHYSKFENNSYLITLERIMEGGMKNEFCLKWLCKQSKHQITKWYKKYETATNRYESMLNKELSRELKNEI